MRRTLIAAALALCASALPLHAQHARPPLQLEPHTHALGAGPAMPPRIPVSVLYVYRLRHLPVAVAVEASWPNLSPQLQW